MYLSDPTHTRADPNEYDQNMFGGSSLFDTPTLSSTSEPESSQPCGEGRAGAHIPQAKKMECSTNDIDRHGPSPHLDFPVEDLAGKRENEGKLFSARNARGMTPKVII